MKYRIGKVDFVVVIDDARIRPKQDTVAKMNSFMTNDARVRVEKTACPQLESAIGKEKAIGIDQAPCTDRHPCRGRFDGQRASYVDHRVPCSLKPSTMQNFANAISQVAYDFS